VISCRPRLSEYRLLFLAAAVALLAAACTRTAPSAASGTSTATLISATASPTSTQPVPDATTTPSSGSRASPTSMSTSRSVPSPVGATPDRPFGPRTKDTGCDVHDAMPDNACTPGAVFPDATAAQICQRGYSLSVRNVPSEVGREVYRAYGITQRTTGEYEVDHLVPLEAGGSNDIANLWPEAAEPRPGFHEKDQVENYLHDQVCSGAMVLPEAQRAIATNWLEVYEQLTTGTIAPSAPAATTPPAQPTPPPPAPTPAPSVPNAAPPQPTQPDINLCGAPANPWKYTYCGGQLITSPPSNLCSVFACISSFWNQTRGYVIQCSDGLLSHSGGRRGSCSSHGGNLRPLYAF
jgi:hypothetical protein